MHRIIPIAIFFLLLLFSKKSTAQQALKLTQQSTVFPYLQINLHGGYVYDNNLARWGMTNYGASNQIAFQLFIKDQRKQQRGYIKTISPVSYKIKFSIPFGSYVESGKQIINLKFQMLDLWMKIGTKWDRTSFWIGNKAVPYGHNPKLDPVSSFTTNLTKLDLGLSQDFGIFFKTPISKGLDLEASLTTGGIFNKPIFTCDHLADGGGVDPTFEPMKLSYDATWLLTARMGQPSFKKNEFGLILVAGHVYSSFVKNSVNFVSRVGGDWTHKYEEKIKIGSQLTTGVTDVLGDATYYTVNGQVNLDIYLFNRFVFSSAFAMSYHQSLESSIMHYGACVNTNSLTYIISPHTRVRLNGFYGHNFETEAEKWGITLQFVTGIGKRS